MNSKVKKGKTPNYWFVGAKPDGKNGPDQTSNFVKKGFWKWNEGSNKELAKEYQALVKSVQVGDYIAIKSTYCKKDFPFNKEGNSISVMGIKAIGIVKENSKDGFNLEVDWKKSFEPKREWCFSTYRLTVHHIVPDNWKRKELIKFTFEEKKQNIDRFLNDPHQNMEQQAKRALHELVEYAFSYSLNTIKGITYEELSANIGRLNKKGKGYGRGMGRILSVMGHNLLDLEKEWGENIPDIQSLVVRKTNPWKGLPGKRIDEFEHWHNYAEWPLEKKEQKVLREYGRIFDFGENRWNKVLADLNIQKEKSILEVDMVAMAVENRQSIAH